jgi:hypothetical protein
LRQQTHPEYHTETANLQSVNTFRQQLTKHCHSETANLSVSHTNYTFFYHVKAANLIRIAARGSITTLRQQTYTLGPHRDSKLTHRNHTETTNLPIGTKQRRQTHPSKPQRDGKLTQRKHTETANLPSGTTQRQQTYPIKEPLLVLVRFVIGSTFKLGCSLYLRLDLS